MIMKNKKNIEQDSINKKPRVIKKYRGLSVTNLKRHPHFRDTQHMQIILNYLEEFKNPEVIAKKMPTVAELCVRLDIAKVTWNRWVREYQGLAYLQKKLETLQEWYLMTHDTVKSIFLLKALFGFSDAPKDVLAVRTQSYDNKSVDELLKGLQVELAPKKKAKMKDEPDFRAPSNP